MIFYVEFAKKLILFSLFTPWFFIRKKRHKFHRTFFKREERGGGNSLKQLYVEGGAGGTCTTNRNEQGGRGNLQLYWKVNSFLVIFQQFRIFLGTCLKEHLSVAAFVECENVLARTIWIEMCVFLYLKNSEISFVFLLKTLLHFRW